MLLNTLNTHPDTETALVADEVKFPEVTQLRNCSTLICPNGHQWSPLVALARCGHGTSQGWNGCGTPILAIKMQNCPICNEPTAKLRLRIDHTPPVPYPSPLCVPGGKSPAEVIMVEIPFRHAAKAEGAADTTNSLKEPEANG